MKVIFFDSGVKNFIEQLSRRDQAKFSKTVELLEEIGFRLTMPFSKKVDHRLYELRILGEVNVRIFYTFHSNTWVLLHAFIKKTDKIPSKELNTAIKRFGRLE